LSRQRVRIGWARALGESSVSPGTPGSASDDPIIREAAFPESAVRGIEICERGSPYSHQGPRRVRLESPSDVHGALTAPRGRDRATRTATPAPVEARALHAEPLPLRIILEVRMLGEGACRHPRISWGSLPRFRANLPTALALSLPPGLAEAAPDPCPLAGHRREARAMSTAARRLMLRGVDRSTILSAHRGRTSCPPWSRSTPEAGRVDRAAPRPPQWTC
jgi:hypothetical protein